MKLYRLLTFLPFLICSSAFANGNPVKNWQLGFQEAVTPLAKETIKTHDFIMIFVWATAIFVALLIIFICFRFKEKNNKIPSTTTHNTLLEIIWITIPVIIVIIVTIPSIKLLFKQEVVPKTEMTLKVIGRQWYWSYEYPDNNNISFDSYMIKKEELKQNEIRLLSTDNKVVLPIKTYIRVQITSSDVIHSWAVPSFGVKTDAVPGKLNETWLYIEKEGTYYGQCSELCGVLHAFMPIEVKAVSKEEFKKWTKKAKEEFALKNPQSKILLTKK